ncbi:MAG: monomethylamine:corrinoid methyltransferase [Anaerolineae bacterium]|jgi:methylamine--corrinoid protein Co-methyltransferase|nr:monomethylamine:corrinoid methyltransferase [Anaerolineae bacterium]MBT4310132.1 monomethylamine:corrinoid methyltransferase [Anaerolineae bacterium]MBT4457930.1 monomethylamine:corrinoid methyltransferase [Anaerolineae bacterium]MBT6062498.1 monomethylamine:corrinoid methyltransferase [Anaerolineae bacterium]MBT6323592.1 monomethylamine:corrinoid methyltransferase [Anaerolineae bacterium]
MLNFLDVYERVLKGPIMSEQDFDMKVFIPALRRVVKEYGIQYDKENPVPNDDVSADNLFDAAVDFLSQVGVYCQDTNRVIQFSKEEILDAVREAPGKCFAGEGKEAGVFRMRKPDEAKTPWLHVGSGIVATSEELITNLIEGYASIAEVDSISISALDSIRGIPVMAGSPAELYAAIRGSKIGREALRRAGRLGLPIMNLISTAAASVTTIAASAPQFGLRPTDGWLVGAISEMKIDFGAMNKSAYLLNWGANVGAESSPILGGYCGGPAGTSVVSTAYILMGLLVQKGSYQLTFPVHFRYGCSTTRDVLWVVAASCQAASRNIPMPVIWLGYMAGGPNTKSYFYEAAAYLLTAVTSGAPSVQTPHPAKAVKIDGITPMEARFGVEMAIAASKLNREQANKLVIQLLEKYESQIETASTGSTYQECYDLTTGKPGEAYIQLFNKMKEELAEMGVPFE